MRLHPHILGFESITPLLPALLLALLILTSGCSAQDVTYIDEDGTYTLDEAQARAAEVGRPGFEGESVLTAEELRQEQLTAFRAQGGDAAVLASLLTEVFPSDQNSVPYYAEAATVGEDEAWIVVELWGADGGTLEHARVWILERDTGRVILSATF